MSGRALKRFCPVGLFKQRYCKYPDHRLFTDMKKSDHFEISSYINVSRAWWWNVKVVSGSGTDGLALATLVRYCQQAYLKVGLSATSFYP